MIYITGDCHRNFKRLNTRIFPGQKEMKKEDYVIICGDFGGVWSKGAEDKEEKYLMDWLDDSAYTPDIETAYLEEIRQKTKFRKWFFGHYHDNRNVSGDEILIYEQMIRIS